MRLDPNNPPESVEFNGITFRLMGGRRKYYLSSAKRTEDRKRPKGLHVAIWEDASGLKVPEKHEINHIDGDTFNCSPENLECLPVAVHRSLPKKNGIERNREVLNAIRPLASAWHRSRAGHSWHLFHGEKTAAALHAGKRASLARAPSIACRCVWCGVEIMAYYRDRKFCSGACAVKDSGFRRGKYKREHPYHAAARLQSERGGG